MAYKVITDFKDLRDGGYQYRGGDVYPHSGDADPERVKALATPTTMRGALIAEVGEELKEEITEKEAEKPATAPKKRGKKEK